MRMEPSNRAELERLVAVAALTGLSGLTVFDAVGVPNEFRVTVPNHPRLSDK
jgi:hypothetical protein